MSFCKPGEDPRLCCLTKVPILLSAGSTFYASSMDIPKNGAVFVCGPQESAERADESVIKVSRTKVVANLPYGTTFGSGPILPSQPEYGPKEVVITCGRPSR